MKISEQFLAQAQTARRTIGIVILRPTDETVASLQRAQAVADLVVVGAKIGGFENVVVDDDESASRSLIGLLKRGQVDGIVRGQAKDSFTLDEFHRQFNRPPLPSNRKIVPGIVENDRHSFVGASFTAYQGLTLDDSIFEADRIVRYMREDLGLEPKIGVTSSLRPTSHTGQFPLLDTVADKCTQLAAHLRARGLVVTEYYSEYERAVWEGCTLIIPALGLVGNAWMKALIYLGGWRLIAAPYLDLGVVYEDGSRNESDFYWHIVHAVAMANSPKENG